MVQIFLYLQNYKHACDIFNVYKLYKVRHENLFDVAIVQERSRITGQVCFRVRLDTFAVCFKDLVNVLRS